MSDERKYRWVGTRPIRHDGVDKVTGRAAYGADLSLPGMLYARILRSPHPHARIRSIDTSAAEKLEGVKAVCTAADLPDLAVAFGEGGEGGPTNYRDLSRNVLARDKVLYDGHAVAAVAATSSALAEAALKQIRVDYEPLPFVVDVLEAESPDAPILHDDLFTSGVEPKPTHPSNIASRVEIGFGDVDAAFARADVVLEREFRTEAVHQGYIEPHACVARFGEDGQYTIWASSQGQFVVRAMTAALLGLETSQVKVVPAEIGGGFGGKTTVYLEPVACVLARKSGRPVKLVMSREEVFRASGPTSGSVIRVKLGALRDGTLVAGDAELHYEAGAFPGSPVATGAMTIFAPYALKDVRAVGYDVVVNRPKTAAYRAPGAPMAAFAVESLVDELARELSIDPLDLRLANAAREGTQAPYGPRFPAVGLVECLEAAKAHPHYHAPLGPNQGRGVAAGFWFNAGMQSSAAVHVNEDGTAVVMSGNPDIGGSRASLAIMAAEELGIDVHKVRPVVADTESIGYNDVTGGSRVTFATGMAVVEAARDVVRQLRERAAQTWDIPVEDVEWIDGEARAKPVHDVAPLSLRQIASKAGRTGGPISGKATLTARGAGPGFGVHICDVELDPDTGRVEVTRYTAIQDVGRAIHPSYVEGQLQGGAAQGIGWALNEAYVYGKDGRLENPGFLDYRVPVASDLPMLDTVLIEVPNDRHPYGVRGVGEVPIVPPLGAVANAVCAASGVRFTALPMSPPAVLAALLGDAAA